MSERTHTHTRTCTCGFWVQFSRLIHQEERPQNDACKEDTMTGWMTHSQTSFVFVSSLLSARLCWLVEGSKQMIRHTCTSDAKSMRVYGKCYLLQLGQEHPWHCHFPMDRRKEISFCSRIPFFSINLNRQNSGLLWLLNFCSRNGILAKFWSFFGQNHLTTFKVNVPSTFLVNLILKKGCAKNEI